MNWDSFTFSFHQCDRWIFPGCTQKCYKLSNGHYLCPLRVQDIACVRDLFWPLLIELFFMHSWPSFSEFLLHFQVFRGPDFLGTVYLNSLVFRDHIHGPRIFHHKTVSNLHALNIFSHSPFHVESFCVHCNCLKYCKHQPIYHWCIFTLFLVGKNSCWKGFA